MTHEEPPARAIVRRAAIAMPLKAHGCTNLDSLNLERDSGLVGHEDAVGRHGPQGQLTECAQGRLALVLTINGKAEVVVQDAEAYQALLERVETIEGIQRGLADVKAGRTKPARKVFDQLRRRYGIPR